MATEEEEKVECVDIQDYEGLYQVTTDGDVISLNYHRTGKKRALKHKVHKNGYHFVNLYKNGVKKKYYIHRLVADAFIPNPLNLPQVNHKNEDKTDNRTKNLEWCDSRYNLNYGTRNKRIAEKNSKSVVQLTKTGEFVRKWVSMSEIKRELNFLVESISQCCNGKYKSAYGFRWMFYEDYLKLKKDEV